MIPLRIFIGYDSHEIAAYHVLSQSIISRASRPVMITPVALDHLVGVYARLRGPTESTEFSMSRFLVPYLSGFEGWSVFMDCDMLAQCDMTDLWLDITANADKAVLVCKHDYVPSTLSKMDGQIQTKYPRKNWSSFMVFNNARCRKLTPHYVNTASGLELHWFTWLEDEEIGSLPLDWNWLVGEYEPNYDARVLHYTLGGPWLPGYRDCDHAEAWLNEMGTVSLEAVG